MIWNFDPITLDWILNWILSIRSAPSRNGLNDANQKRINESCDVYSSLSADVQMMQNMKKQNETKSESLTVGEK